MGLIKKILNLQGTAEDGTILNLRGVKNTLLKVADSLTGNIFSFRNRDKVELLNIKNDGIYTPNLIDTSNTSYKSLVIDENGKIQKKQTSIVATSGAYDDLTGKPTLFSGAYVDLTGKPNLFSGDYDDLLNLPTLFSGNYNSLTNKPDLSVLNDVVIEDSLNDFPSVGNDDFVYIAKNTGEMYRWNGSSYTQLTDQTAIWGQVSGTLSNQNDLQNALNGKADNSDVFSGNYNDLSNKPNLSIYVDKSSNETIGGIKTFTSNSIFNGNVGIGTNSPSAKLEVNGNIKANGDIIIGANDYIKASNSWLRNNSSSLVLSNQGSGSMFFRPNGDGNGSGEMKLFQSGNLEVKGDVEAFVSSDKRLKTNIKSIDKPIDKISKIGGYTYEWNDKSDKETGKKDIGVIAQEIEKVLPELVQTRENGYKAVKYDKIVALLIEGIKEQDLRIKELENKIK